MSSKPKTISRRQFIAKSTKTAAGIVAATAFASAASKQPVPSPKSRIRGANDRITMAAIGIRSRGKGLLYNFAGLPDVQVKTICDVDENLFPERVKKVEEIQGLAPTTEYDLRRVFDDKDIDAVVIATPNHWHALATIWACQAGKHVYVEKPCSHNVREGRKMVEAARRYNRVVQVGFQNRSNSNVNQALKFLHDGKLGEIYMTKGLCFKPRGSIGTYPDGPAPEGQYTADYLKKVHYDDLWLGPAPTRPFNRNRFHYNWHWHWDYGNGDIGNQGPHQFDIARWGLNKNEHPVKISASGGFFVYKDSCQETPNTEVAAFTYADGKILQFEVRGVRTNDEAGVKIGNLFFGTEGWMSLNGKTWKTFFGRKNEPGPSSENAGEFADPANLAGAGGAGHIGNFMYALKSGNYKDLTSDIESSHLSSSLPHMANISYRLGRDLEFNGDKEKFVGDKEANRMLTRKYRKPYVVPNRV